MTDNREIPSNSSPSTTPSDHRASLAGEPPTPRVARRFDWATSAYRLAVVGLLAFIAYTMKTGTISANAWVRGADKWATVNVSGTVDVGNTVGVRGTVDVEKVRNTVNVSGNVDVEKIRKTVDVNVGNTVDVLGRVNVSGDVGVLGNVYVRGTVDVGNTVDVNVKNTVKVSQY